MDVTNMPVKTHPLLHKLIKDYPHITFTPAETFWWSPSHATVHYRYSDSTSALDVPKLLHEVSHAALEHDRYIYDIELVQMERDAWTHAQTILAPKYNVIVPTDSIEDALESYRCWLHARSTCPECDSNGVQTKTGPYKCLACGGQWRANEARICELRRFKL